MLMAVPFKKMFGRSIDDFWIDNTKGLDIVKFDEVLVNSGSKPLLTVIKARWGAEAVKIVRRILPKTFSPQQAALPQKPKPARSKPAKKPASSSPHRSPKKCGSKAKGR